MKYFWLMILLLSACSSPKPQQKMVDDEDYLVALQYIKEKKLILASPLLTKKCKQGLLAACLANGAPVGRELLDGVEAMQGATDTNTTQITALIPKGKQVYPLIWKDLKLISDNDYTFEILSRSHSDYAVMKVMVKNLKLGQNYRIDFLDDKSLLMDFRYFKAFDNRPASLRFVVASCLSDEYDSLQQKIWPELLDQNADVLFLIGDNVYGDWVNHAGVKEGVGEAALWKRYVDTRKQLAFYKIENLIPTYALWDDHDYGKNNGDKYFEHKADNLQVFQSFWAQSENSLLKPGHGAGFYLSLRGHHFYFLDNRFFRDPSNDRLGGHFGSEQEKWLFKYLKSNRSHNWIISGDQFFGEHHPFESFEGLHPNKFKDFLTNLSRSKAKVFLISGDRHLTELMEIQKEEIGSKTYEVTSSGLHAKYFPETLKKYTSKRMLDGAAGVPNYVVIDSNATQPLWELDLKALSVGSKTLYSHFLTVE